MIDSAALDGARLAAGDRGVEQPEALLRGLSRRARPATSGRMLEKSMHSVPGLALAKTPSSPPSTASTSGESGTMVIDHVGVA